MLMYPVVSIIYSFYHNNFPQKYIDSGLDYDTGLSGLEGLPGLDFESSDDYTSCGDAYHLGFTDIIRDCSDVCKSGDYEYKFINKNHQIIINKRRLYGAYCIRKAIAKCNLNTSMAIIGLDEYKCISHYPTILGGESGNLIIACNGVIVDRLLKKTYDTFIPNNLSLISFDERLEDGETFRFVCETNTSSIQLPANIATRLETDVNTCGMLDPSGTLDFNQQKCTCNGRLHVNGDETNICSRCISGFGVDTGIHGWRYGYSISRDCVDPLTSDSVLTSFINFPCGEKSLVNKKYCQSAILAATNTYTPMALENMFK